ncbi:MAG: tRNA (adenosine(37)-N6)-threonylcarbamoyltransferase complex transferase subunit TsaD, partial [Albidovulum sp.]|nr:tRNA (adenosine(37)-N6)-threonylcarbamoyltransferase complex transferase subunit TsaD [Albidovulum sp.]
KTARLLNLGQPGGPAIEAASREGDPCRFRFPRPLLDRAGCNMSFSGLKTSLLRTRDRLMAENGLVGEQDVADICAAFQKAVSDVLTKKSYRAIAEFRDRIGKFPRHFAASGGVAANLEIRKSLKDCCQAMEIEFVAPPLQFCTDNAAMIAWAGAEEIRANKRADSKVRARPRWPLDEKSPPVAGFGKKGAKA